MQQDRAQGLFVQARARMLLEAGCGLKVPALWGLGFREWRVRFGVLGFLEVRVILTRTR